jgi:hypothetical protein
MGVGGNVGIGAAANSPAAPLHVTGVARADQFVTSPLSARQLMAQGAALDAVGGPLLLGSGGGGGTPGAVSIPHHAEIGPAWVSSSPGATNPQPWRYGDCELKVNMLQRAATYEQTYSAYGIIGSVNFAPTQADQASLHQWGWLCWNRTDTNEDDDLLHPFLGSLRPDAAGPYTFPTASGTQKYSVRGRITLNIDYNNWSATNQKVCGRVGWTSAVESDGSQATNSTNARILAWAGNSYYYGLYDLTEATPSHALWADTNGEHSSPSGNFDRWSLWTCR